METFTAPLLYRRHPTRVVRVGDVAVGGDQPIRIQSMLTCNTWDVDAVLAEIRGLVHAGCEIVRVTVPTQKDVSALPAIRERMAAEGLRVPLVADIHFNPRLALAVVPYVEKVRINPGNYVDQKRFAVREYTDAEYAAELERIDEALTPLIAALQKHGRSLRIGVNHGSLADRIFNRYGDTPEGMVESAMEYLRVLYRHGFHETIISMKASNPLVVIQAYRLLALRMAAEGMDYPLHLGVTEAGDGLAGRIKSAIGIGALLCDGLGDTIRVSLTEPAANEIPAAKDLVAAVLAMGDAPAWPGAGFQAPIAFRRRETRPVQVGAATLGGGEPVAFLALDSGASGDVAEPFDALVRLPHPEGPMPGEAVRVIEGPGGAAAAPVVLVEARAAVCEHLAQLLGRAGDFPQGAAVLVWGRHPLHAVRQLAGMLAARGLDWPLGVVVPEGDGEQGPGLGPAAEIGSLAADGLLDAVVCPTSDATSPTAEYCRTLMQAARLRIYKTEYISCPACGRTLFDLQETTERIKARTVHLKGLKIGVMGCIVNGPGEMADADFGYVGGAPGKVNLYKGQTCVTRGVPTGEAVERLVALIKEHGRWVEPPAA